MDLVSEAVTSLVWILKSLVISSICFCLALTLLIKFTRWGHQFWQLTKTYFLGKHGVVPLITFTIIVFLTLLSVRLDVIFSQWYNNMYKSLQDLNEEAFWQQMIFFCIIAGINLINVLVIYFVKSKFNIHWREWLNSNFLDRWLSNQSFYKTQYTYNQLDNPDQRIQQDITAYVENSMNFSTGVISATVSIVAFTGILWNLSGPMTIAGFEIPHMMVFLVFIYVLITSVFAFRLGRPLIKLNFANEKLNADYRYSLIRIKEYAESIAFYAGEKIERILLNDQFRKIIDNVWKLVYRTLKLSGFNLVVSQVSVVFPFIIQAHRFFSKQITLGDMVQTAQAFGQVHSSLSFFRNSYDAFTEYRATLERLSGFTAAIQTCQQSNVAQIAHNTDDVIFDQLSVYNAEGKTLLKQLNLTLKTGQRLLIQGPSGVGKTTLLRTIAGLWLYSEGKIQRPDEALFLSQKSYLPQGTLRSTLYYPNTIPDNDQARAAEILKSVQLAHLIDKLDEERDWTKILSLGEQQRVAIARLLLAQPKVAFLDEATSSMDEGLEFAMYQLLIERLPNTILISVGHRSTLHQHHSDLLTLLGNGEWQAKTIH
ncbi:ABC transporter ATP-binding protein [Gallibacterium salpingitidis]|uniref:ABC transporter ATP-binding protein n=1 Tax=Gallibacterium salpingitidis TaxID=505341 RepID=A0AB36E0F0_9PAST|nr:ABC transporter ATP-binding protein/permease [Gallibacterium salpingitidis]OBX08006.1 ABC transporter ATP-binding protein [Gallibacterium salpingitidis]WKS99104.1 ABC transporter ATP-binding protein/permease [Gallibacterium salpingitidis]